METIKPGTLPSRDSSATGEGGRRTEIQERLIGALKFALVEICHPGISRRAGFDICDAIHRALKAARDDEAGPEDIDNLVSEINAGRKS
jgi:hypothetical protein